MDEKSLVELIRSNLKVEIVTDYPDDSLDVHGIKVRLLWGATLIDESHDIIVTH